MTSLVLEPFASQSNVAVSMTSVGSSAATTVGVWAGLATTSAASAPSDEPNYVQGPPSWHQEVYIGNGYPYYRPNFILLSTIAWLVMLLLAPIWAAIILRRSKRKNHSYSVVQAVLTWRAGYWSAILCMFVSLAFAVIDDGVRRGARHVQQSYFLAQFLFNSFDYLAQIFLLFAIYNLIFHLKRWSSLQTKGFSDKYFRTFIAARFGLCISLGVIAVVLESLSIAYLTRRVFAPDALSTEGVGGAAFNVNLVFGILYWVAALEVLVLSGHMIRLQKKHALGKRKIYVTNLFVTAIPFFVAATVHILAVFASVSPLAMYANSNDGQSYVFVTLCVYAGLGPLGFICTLGGIATMAQSLDASSINDGEGCDQGERLDSIDVVMMDRDPQAAHDPPAR